MCCVRGHTRNTKNTTKTLQKREAPSPTAGFPTHGGVRRSGRLDALYVVVHTPLTPVCRPNRKFLEER